MKKQLILVLICLCITAATVSAQNIYRSATGRERSPEEIAAMRLLYDKQRQDAQIERLRSAVAPATASPSSSVLAALYSKEQLKFINSLSKPSDSEKAIYGNFLNRSNTGFMTLLTETECVPKTDKQDAAQTVKNCSSKSLPGQGAYYSFRLKNYIHSSWADIGFKQNWFFSIGYLTQSVFVKLGDLPIENITLKSNGMKFLTDFVPSKIPEDADKQRIELEKGIENSDFIYYNAIEAVQNQTYALRSIAYQGKVITILNSGKSKSKIDWLNGDERRDVIVVFRIIGKDEKGNVKIVWRELQSKESAKLELPTNEVNTKAAGN